MVDNNKTYVYDTYQNEQQPWICNHTIRMCALVSIFSLSLYYLFSHFLRYAFGSVYLSYPLRWTPWHCSFHVCILLLTICKIELVQKQTRFQINIYFQTHTNKSKWCLKTSSSQSEDDATVSLTSCVYSLKAVFFLSHSRCSHPA